MRPLERVNARCARRRGGLALPSEDVDGLLLDDGPDPRAGRLVGFDGGHHPRRQSELLAHDVGVDGGAASSEEAAVHVVDDDDDDVRSDG